MAWSIIETLNEIPPIVDEIVIHIWDWGLWRKKDGTLFLKGYLTDNSNDVRLWESLQHGEVLLACGRYIWFKKCIIKLRDNPSQEWLEALNKEGFDTSEINEDNPLARWKCKYNYSIH